VAAVPVALADASAPAAAPAALVVFFTVAAYPRDNIMSAVSAATFFALVAFFSSAALVAAAP
jgi:hypothetical protein